MINSANSSSVAWIMNCCRVCKHFHPSGIGLGCYDVIMSSIVFVICNCREHVPEDNLEYLEYLTKKKESL